MPYYHHGEYTTLRQAVEAHAGEASGVMTLWNALTPAKRNEVIEFLKSLQILPSNAKGLVCDANGKKTGWPTFPWVVGQDVPPLP
jgi:hypothetical protein